ncbi:MAG: hypothetical protein NC043_08165, partial [Muribaculaceae bacterium]|nr:hypothetical protein [Muribaculaceae bacterium]
VRYRVVRLKAADAVADSAAPPADSVYAVLPVEIRMYSDTLYDAWVSGYEARLDSLRLRLPQHTVVKTPIRGPVRRGRIGLGVSAGVGWDGRSFTPYVGVGVNWTLFSL